MFHPNQRPFRRLTAAGFAIALLALIPPLGAQDKPAETPCPVEEYDKAVNAKKEIDEKIAELDKLPGKPAGKFTHEYENDKQSADADLKLAETNVKTAEKNLEDARQALANAEAAKGVKASGKPEDQVAGELKQVTADLAAKRVELIRAKAARDRLDNDAVIAELNKSLQTEQAELDKQIAQYMQTGTKRSEVLSRINDTSYRLDFSSRSSDEQVVQNARALESYTTFRDDATAVQRTKLSAGLAARGAVFKDVDAPDPIKQMREAGAQLVKEIDRCRLAVDAANRPVINREAAITARRKALDADGTAADLVAGIPQLDTDIKDLEAAKTGLDAQSDLRKKVGEVESCQKSLDLYQRELPVARKAAKDADLALANHKAYGAALEPLALKKKTIEADIERLGKIVEAETKAKDTVKSKAQADYAANEKELADFRVEALKKKADIDKQRAGDPKGADAALKQLAKDVKAKKEASVTKLKAIQEALQKYRHCYKDVDEYVENTIKPKIHKLGGTAEAGIAVADTEDPWDALLDVPVDKGGPAVAGPAAGPRWVCEKPEIVAGARMTPSDSGVTMTVENAGKTQSASISWTGVKKEYREGEEVTLTMNASGDAAALGWFNVGCAGKWLHSDNNVATWKDGKRSGASYSAAKLVFKFEPGGNPYIQVQAGQEAGTSRWATITWKFKKVDN